MTGLKRKTQGPCPKCSSDVDVFQINVDCAIEMCENTSCAYPFDRPDAEGLIHEFPYNDTRYSKKLKTHSSSVANTVAATSKASDDENSVKSVKASRPVIIGSSSLMKQKDQLYLEGQTSSVKQAHVKTGSSSTQNITHKAPPFATSVCLPGNIVLPPSSAARTSTQPIDSSSSNITSYSLSDIESLLSDINATSQQNDNASSTSFINTANNQNITQDYTAVITLDDTTLCNQDHTTMSTQDHNTASTQEHNTASTQDHNTASTQDHNTASTQDHNIVSTQDNNTIPTTIHSTAPLQNHINQDHITESIQDHTTELTQDHISDCLSPSSATVKTPKDASEMSWMEDLDALFGADMDQSKFDPLGANEFDSILGI